MKHLVIGQRQKTSNFSAFHWSPHVCLVSIGQHFVTTRVVHLPKRTEASLYQIGPKRAVHSCNSLFLYLSRNLSKLLFGPSKMVLLCAIEDSVYSGTSKGSDVIMTSNCIYDITFSSALLKTQMTLIEKNN